MRKYNYNIGKLFTEVAAINHNSIALKYPDGIHISYGHLESLSNQIARFFIDSGIRKGNVIAILNNKSVLGFSSMLACLKIGAVYTNLDPSSPYPRIKKILERCKPVMILVDIQNDYLKGNINEIGTPIVELNEEFSIKLSGIKAHHISESDNVTGSDPAYIMFTSGSTGFPKGAVISHSNLVNFISWAQDEFNISKNDVFTNANPIYFDNSVFDFYVSLFSGAQLVPITNDLAKDPFGLIKEVNKAGCTSWFSVPSLLVYLLTTKALYKDCLPQMKRFIFGGEGFPKSKLKKLFDLFGSGAQLFNVYGPTECTCICSSYRVTQKDFDDMNSLTTLGHLAPNFDYVLLNHNEDTPMFGELGLKGPNVGLGYYNDAERTEGSFIQNPFNKDYREVIYKTGDLVEIDEAGNIHFRGRADNQVKHMGYRIELEEIEAMLNTLTAINEVAVIYENLGDGLGQIIAYVSTSAIVEENEIFSDIKKLLPDYMIPRKIYILGSLPKNQNGKIDRVTLKEKKTSV